MPYAESWTCHNCGNGPMLIANNPACIDCGHRHANCVYCTYAARSRPTQSYYASPSSTTSQRPRSQYTAPAPRYDDRRTSYSSSGSRYYTAPSSRAPSSRNEPTIIVRRPASRY
ncbi:hypothetical protein FQN54_007043 [Arachnomyces sp. PD_36]|nr:hypothetical protein FQN54_007043 [Arachnomyces sp. PD_36]